LGLKTLQEGGDEAQYLNAVKRYRMPQPRTDMIDTMQKYAHAAADISDGLLADCVHIARASKLTAEINLDQIPLSDEVRRAVDQGMITTEQAIKGGDDYELIIAAAPQNVAQFKNATPIGKFTSGQQLLKVISSDDFDCDTENLGWTHF